MIFTFEKLCKLPVAKASPDGKNILRYFGGISINDGRSYLRFKNSNREELAKEYLKEYLQKRKSEDNVQEIDNKERKGKFKRYP